MDTPSLQEAIKVCIRQINANLEEAARVARAAEACVLAGNFDDMRRTARSVIDLVSWFECKTVTTNPGKRRPTRLVA